MEEIDFTQDIKELNGCAMSEKLAGLSIAEMREQLTHLKEQSGGRIETKEGTLGMGTTDFVAVIDHHLLFNHAFDKGSDKAVFRTCADYPDTTDFQKK